MTSLSVVVALGIGAIELLQLAAAEFGVTTGPLATLADLDMERLGYLVVALFIVTWLVALAVWRWSRIGQRWQPTMKTLEITGRAAVDQEVTRAGSTASAAATSEEGE